MRSTPPDCPSRRRSWFWPLGLAAFLALAAVAHAFVHEGKSFAIEAAVPQLELEENPFVLRESWWNGELKAGETKIIKHQLFKRNDYWFWLGISQPDSKVSIHIYDSEGRLCEEEAWQDRHVAAARVVPEKTGVYYIRIAVDEVVDPPAEWAVVYGYR